MSKRRMTAIALAVLAAVIAIAFLAVRSPREEGGQGPFTADGRCPSFKARYPNVDIRFGNRGLSVLNSLYKTFAGEGAFEIREFTVVTGGAGRFKIVGASNRGR